VILGIKRLNSDNFNITSLQIRLDIQSLRMSSAHIIVPRTNTKKVYFICLLINATVKNGSGVGMGIYHHLFLP
jgi:hypothetical protein